jgi:ABC-type amino acid transport system permease subunit
MSSYVIGLISFAAIFGGALIGLFVRRRLPGHHLSSETQSAVTVSVAVIGTLSAFLLGLMVAAADSNYSKVSDEVREASTNVIRIERNLRRYGQEANDARAKLREWATIKLEQLSPEKGQSPPSPQKGIETLENMQHAILGLTPKDEEQKYLQTLCVALSSNLIQERWLLEQHTGHDIPVPFLVLLIFWLAIVFASFGVFAPANSTTIVALLLCSVAVAGGIALTQDLDDPSSGFIRFPSEPMRKAFSEITH